MAGYDRNNYVYDSNGRRVPPRVQQVWRRKGEVLTLDDRSAEHPGSGVVYTYEPPFQVFNREADLRQAHAEFARRFSNSA